MVYAEKPPIRKETLWIILIVANFCSLEILWHYFGAFGFVLFAVGLYMRHCCTPVRAFLDHFAPRTR